MERLRILHTADNHLGAKFTGLGTRGRDQRRKLIETFDKIVELAIEARVHLFLVAGDLFDSNRPSPELVHAVLHGFDRLDGHAIEVCLAPGTHDRYDASSIYRRPEFASLSNFHLFERDTMTPLELPALRTTVWGRALSQSQPGDVLAGLHRDGPSQWQLALVHGSLRMPGVVEEDEAMVDTASLGACGMDYVALGHWHSLADYSRWGTPAYYSGAPEPMSVSDRDAGYVILVELTLNAGAEIRPVRVSRRRAEVLQVNMDEIADGLELRRRIEERADENLMLDVVLRGVTRHDLLLDPVELRDDLAPFFFHLRIKDSSSLSVEDLGALHFPENTLSGRFVELARKRIAESSGEESGLLQEALKVGLSYLARGDAG